MLTHFKIHVFHEDLPKNNKKRKEITLVLQVVSWLPELLPPILEVVVLVPNQITNIYRYVRVEN